MKLSKPLNPKEALYCGGRGLESHRRGVSPLGEDGTGMHILAGFGIRTSTMNAHCHSVPSTEAYKTQIWLPDQPMNQIPCLSNKKKTRQGKVEANERRDQGTHSQRTLINTT
ncbi:hypothetical protein V8C34DRAFT_273771 [Trichoderma compactum]